MLKSSTQGFHLFQVEIGKFRFDATGNYFISVGPNLAVEHL